MLRLLTNVYVRKDASEETKLAAEELSLSMAEALRFYKWRLDIPISVKVVFEEINDCTAYYDEETLSCRIDPFRRHDSEQSRALDIMEILAHEMVHAEQFFQGRLAHVLNRKKKIFEHHWKGPTMFLTDNGIPIEAKDPRVPWEAEAYQRQAALRDECYRAIVGGMDF